jgi:transcriptional regulator with AAA-type ATPase domain
MSTLAEIEIAVDALPPPQQEELLRHLAERLGKRGEPKSRLPLVPATGRPITQGEIDDALDAD